MFNRWPSFVVSLYLLHMLLELTANASAYYGKWDLAVYTMPQKNITIPPPEIYVQLVGTLRNSSTFRLRRSSNETAFVTVFNDSFTLRTLPLGSLRHVAVWMRTMGYYQRWNLLEISIRNRLTNRRYVNVCMCEFAVTPIEVTPIAANYTLLSLRPTPCEDTKFGAKCDKRCTCFYNDMCRKEDGTCVRGGCARGWMNGSNSSNCQTPCPETTFGLGCRKICRCLGALPCDKVSGECPTGCLERHTGKDCQTKCKNTQFVDNGACVYCRCLNHSECPTNGVCSICEVGQRGMTCQEACLNGTYGQNCSEVCNCINDTSCDRLGYCSGSCAQGFFGDRCHLFIPSAALADQTHTKIGKYIAISFVAIFVFGGMCYCVSRGRIRNAQKSGSLEREKSDDDTISVATGRSVTFSELQQTRNYNKTLDVRQAKKTNLKQHLRFISQKKQIPVKPILRRRQMFAKDILKIKKRFARQMSFQVPSLMTPTKYMESKDAVNKVSRTFSFEEPDRLRRLSGVSNLEIVSSTFRSSLVKRSEEANENQVPVRSISTDDLKALADSENIHLTKDNFISDGEMTPSATSLVAPMFLSDQDYFTEPELRKTEGGVSHMQEYMAKIPLSLSDEEAVPMPGRLRRDSLSVDAHQEYEAKQKLKAMRKQIHATTVTELREEEERPKDKPIKLPAVSDLSQLIFPGNRDTQQVTSKNVADTDTEVNKGLENEFLKESSQQAKSSPDVEAKSEIPDSHTSTQDGKTWKPWDKASTKTKKKHSVSTKKKRSSKKKDKEKKGKVAGSSGSKSSSRKSSNTEEFESAMDLPHLTTT